MTLIVSHGPPTNAEMRTNRLPARKGAFSLYLRAYWPEDPILEGSWIPPDVVRGS